MNDDYSLNDGVLTISPGTICIRAQQFCGREDIRKVIIPEGVQFMEPECFADCSWLEEVTLPSGIRNIGAAAFADCSSLIAVNIPTSAQSIDSGAFLQCEALKDIQIPEGVETICEHAFQNSGLESVIVPESVAVIEECAFFSCENLRRADVLGKHTVLGEDCFGSNYALVEGYIAPGYPVNADTPAILLYTLLWCSCPQRHDAVTSQRASTFIRENESLIMEWIIKANNIPAMNGLAGLGLLSSDIISGALNRTLLSGQKDLSALLLKAKLAASPSEGDFEL